MLYVYTKPKECTKKTQSTQTNQLFKISFLRVSKPLTFKIKFCHFIALFLSIQIHFSFSNSNHIYNSFYHSNISTNSKRSYPPHLKQVILLEINNSNSYTFALTIALYLFCKFFCISPTSYNEKCTFFRRRGKLSGTDIQRGCQHTSAASFTEAKSAFCLIHS